MSEDLQAGDEGPGGEGPGRSGDGQPWWRADTAGDPSPLLGPEGMAAVGSVADEALKLYSVVKQRLEAAGVTGATVRSAMDALAAGGASAVGSPAAAQAGAGLAGLWSSVGPAVIRSVEEIAGTAASAAGTLAHQAAGAQEDRLAAPVAGPTGSAGEAEGRADPEPGPDPQQGVDDLTDRVLPGQAAACGYCPVCQAIALFRSVPMGTWQRLGAAVVDAADAAPAGDWRPGTAQRSDVVAVHDSTSRSAATDPVTALLDDILPAGPTGPDDPDEPHEDHDGDGADAGPHGGVS